MRNPFRGRHAQDERRPLLEGSEEQAATVQPIKTPLPRMQLLILCVMRLSEPIAFTCIFPFIPQMLHDNLPGVPRKQIGYYAGLIESLFALVQFLTGLLWGTLSDRIGRKPVLLIGLAGTCLSVNAFGLSRSFHQMIAARAINGLMNGNVAVIKSMLGELTDETNQARAFSFLPLMYAVGSIIGPTIGGSLSDPVNGFPSLFGDSEFLRKYPYWLPCGVAGSLNVIGFIIGFFFLKETLPSKVVKEVPPTPIIESSGTATPTLTHRLSEPDLHRATLSRASSRLRLKRAAEARAAEAQVAAAAPDPVEAPVPFRHILTPSISVVLCNQALINLSNIAYSAALPLFCYATVAEGGIGFSKRDIGNLMAMNGVFSIVVQLLLFPYLERRVGGPQPLLKRVLPSMALTFAFFPLAHYAARIGRPELIATLGFMILAKSMGGMAVVTGTLCVNNVAPNRASLGRINGMAQSLGSLSRAIGPVMSSSLFAFSLEHPKILGGQLIWLCLFSLAAGNWLLSLRIRGANKAAWRQKPYMEASAGLTEALVPEEVFTTLRLNAASDEASFDALLPVELSALLSPSPVSSSHVSHALSKRIPLLSAHLERLTSAVAALHKAAPAAWPAPESLAGVLAPSSLLSELDRALRDQVGARRVKLALARSGLVRIEHAPLSPSPPAPTVRLDSQPTVTSSSLSQVIARHKTSSRAAYDDARARVGATLGANGPADACFDVLLWERDAAHGDALLESSIACIVLQLATSPPRFITPPSSRPLLPGLGRNELLVRGALSEEDLSSARLREELDKGGKIWLVNALRGAWEVRLAETRN